MFGKTAENRIFKPHQRIMDTNLMSSSPGRTTEKPYSADYPVIFRHDIDTPVSRFNSILVRVNAIPFVPAARNVYRYPVRNEPPLFSRGNTAATGERSRS